MMKMNVEMIDELDFVRDFNQSNIETFHKFIKDYDKFMAPILRSQGWKHENNKARTIVFTFGEVTFFRRIWKRGGETRCPVDEKLSLDPYVKYSKEMMAQICYLATMLPYGKVVEVMKLLCHVNVSKSTVLNSVKLAQKFLEKGIEYEVCDEKINSDVIYVEGDEFDLSQKSSKNHHRVTHFLVHTGVQDGSDRRELVNKKSFLFLDYHRAYKNVVDYIKSSFDMTSNTILITNSDNEGNFSKESFQNLAKDLNIVYHEHFIDEFFQKQRINFANIKTGSLFKKELLKGIKEHKKKEVVVILDKIISEIKDKSEKKKYFEFYNWLLNNFEDLKTSEQRNLNVKSIGVLQTQHRKVARRMKKIGMNWSDKGADTICQLIIMREENPDSIRELFFNPKNTRKESIIL